MPENPRIEELRRRVQADPASIAFAALAEEYRRLGRYDEAVETCLAGLQRHPAYLSARVTLGRALIETGNFDSARDQFETVLRSAPENIAATRGLAQILERLGHSTEMDPQLAQLMREHAQTAPPLPPRPEPIRVAPTPDVLLPSPEPAPVDFLALKLPEPPEPDALAPVELTDAVSEPLSDPLHDLPLEALVEAPFPEASPDVHLDASPHAAVEGPGDVEATPQSAWPAGDDLQAVEDEGASSAEDVLHLVEAPGAEDVTQVADVPDPAVIAAIARLERFLSAIDVARRT